MFLAKKLFGLLLGKSTPLFEFGKSRTEVINFPAKEDGDVHRELRFSGDDGLILHFMKKIEALEERCAKLEDELANKSKK